MRTEISQAKREANFYLESVDKNKAIKAIVERKRKRNQESTDYRVRYNIPICWVVLLHKILALGEAFLICYL